MYNAKPFDRLQRKLYGVFCSHFFLRQINREYAASHQETGMSMMNFLNQQQNSLFNLLDDSRHAPIKDKNKLSQKKEHSKSVSSNKTMLVSSSDVGIADYNEYDVLSGRGSSINTHAGNGYFRYVINEHRRTYLNSKWQKRREIAKSIVDSIRARGGRFLKQANEDDKNSLWYEIGDKGAIDKTTQALRQMKMRRKLMVEDEKNNKHQIFNDTPALSQATQVQVINPSFGPTFGQNFPNVHPQPSPFSMTDATNLWLSQQLQQLGGLTPPAPSMLSNQYGGFKQDNNAMNRSARHSFTHGDVMPYSQPWNHGDYGSESFDERLTPFRCFGL
jgi:hypothetical protein